MFGAPGRIMQSAHGDIVIVIQGNNGATYGYISSDAPLPAIGSVSPAALNGQNIEGIYWVEVGVDLDIFTIYIEGNLAQSFFAVANVEGFGSLLSANADDHSYNATYDFTQWRFDNINRPALWGGAGNVRVIFS